MRGLATFLVRRLLLAGLLVFVVSSGALMLAHLAPGDVTSELVGTGVSAETIALQRTRYGLDRPIFEQYAAWLGRSMRFDFGTSLRYGRPVSELVGERAFGSGILALTALVLATIVGLPLGVLSGSRQRSAVATLVRGLSVTSLSLPPLLTSLVLALVAAQTGWFPVGGMGSLDAQELGWFGRAADLAWHLALPAVAIALPIAAVLERLQSQALAETLEEPFILSALGRGVSRPRVLWVHALRIAIRPVVAVYGIVVGSLLSGSFAVEVVMAWPGLGRLMFEALTARDVHLVAGCAAAGALFLAGGTLMADLAHAMADPRVREAE